MSGSVPQASRSATVADRGTRCRGSQAATATDRLNPTIFLVAACIVCSIVSLATGSSWSTVATVGIALLGIGKALDIHEGVIAGAIISGAYFGDKMSPLSDTTNLAPAMAGTVCPFRVIPVQAGIQVCRCIKRLCEIAFACAGMTALDDSSGNFY